MTGHDADQPPLGMDVDEYFALMHRRKLIMGEVQERLMQLHEHGIEIDEDAAPAFHRELVARDQARGHIPS